MDCPVTLFLKDEFKQDSKITFENSLAVSKVASQRLGILRKSWTLGNFSMIDAFGILSCPFYSTALQCSPQLPIHILS